MLHLPFLPRPMLGQRANHPDLRAIMDEGKILLLDLGCSDGESNRLIGSPVVTGVILSNVAGVVRIRRVTVGQLPDRGGADGKECLFVTRQVHVPCLPT